jgi:hypothetical protein
MNPFGFFYPIGIIFDKIDMNKVCTKINEKTNNNHNKILLIKFHMIILSACT